MTQRRIWVGLIGVALAATGACSGGDEPLVGAQVPTTAVPTPGAGFEVGETVDVADALSAIDVAASSTDFCDVAAALGTPLPTVANESIVEIYERLADLVESSTKLVPTDDAFPTFAADWEQLGESLATAATAIAKANGETTDPVFVASLRGDAVTMAIETVERYRRERCDAP